MIPQKEAELRDEIARLRRDLSDLNDRHQAGFSAISKSIAALESGMSLNSEVSKASAPPPLLEKFSAPAPQAPPAIAPIPPPLPKNPESLESSLGKTWFVRVGIVILLTGLIFLGNYAYQNWIKDLSNGVRLTALATCAIALTEAGRRLAIRPDLHRFGEVVMAGGMSLIYYCVFAAHHVPALKVIASPVPAAILLTATALGITAISWLRNSRTIAALGFILASYATMLQPIGWLSSFSSVLLAALGLATMLRTGWSGPGWASMLGSYTAFFGSQILGSLASSVDFATSQLWFLAPVWFFFVVPSILNRFRASLSERARAWFTAGNNTLFFITFSIICLSIVESSSYWKFPAIFGPVLIILGIIGRRADTRAGTVNISQGIAIGTFAIILKLDGFQLPLILAIESLALALAAWRFRTRTELIFSILAGTCATVAILIDPTSPDALRHTPFDPLWVALLAAAFLAAAAVFIRKSPDPAARAFSIILTLASVLIAVFSLHPFIARHQIDALAIIALIFLLISSSGKFKLIPEALILSLLSFANLLAAFATTGWDQKDGTTWRGIALVLSSLIATFLFTGSRKSSASPLKNHNHLTILIAFTCFLTAAWSTQMLVWRLGWTPAAILWTILGFSFVALGLWRELPAMRLSGFLLLATSLAKLFLIDVWDFSAFTRVVSFILLGTALIVLGLFYNRFTHAFKTLLDDGRGTRESG